jgi:protein-disulfide isomerase
MNALHLKWYFKIGLAAIIFVSSVHAATQNSYLEGVDYVKLPTELRNNSDIAQLLMNDPNKIQLLYFFSYGCPACARFDPDFEKWINMHKNKKLVIHKLPVAFKEEWINLAKLYYVMKALDPKETLNDKIFKAIHDKNLQLRQIPIMKQFFIDAGYSGDDFEKAINSFSVNLEVKKSKQLSVAYSITQTPTIIINGFTNSYKLNRDKDDVDNFFKIISYLIEKDLKN